MQLPFPKHLPPFYPTPPVGNNVLRRRNNTKNHINKQQWSCEPKFHFQHLLVQYRLLGMKDIY